MAQEVGVTMALRMRDEASASMQQFGDATQAAQIEALQMNVALTAMGGALSAVGSLIGQLDSPMAKMASTFLLTAGAMLTTTSAIIMMVPEIRKLITWLRNLAIAQVLVRALAGPAGWVTLGVGLAIAGAATAGIIGLTGGFGGGGGGGRGMTVNINAEAFTGSDADARKFASKVQRFTREDTRIGR